MTLTLSFLQSWSGGLRQPVPPIDLSNMYTTEKEPKLPLKIKESKFGSATKTTIFYDKFYFERYTNTKKVM